MAHKYTSIQDDGIALDRLPLSSISEHDSEGAREETNGELHADEVDDIANGGSDLEGLLGRKERTRVRGRKWRGWIWIGCFSFLGVLVFSVLFSVLFLVLARKYVPGLLPAETPIVSEEPASWVGWQEIRYMFIFGDSYSTVGYDIDAAHPSADNPIGNPALPGKTTSNGYNWVGFLSTQHNLSTILVHDYAVSGNTVKDVERQVFDKFSPYAGKKPDWAPWTAQNSLFFTWIGINDLLHDWSGIEGVQRQLDRLFELQHLIYDSGARNFIFFNVPPFERAPCCTQGDIRSRVRHWNSALFNHTSNFRSSHPDASIAIYDAAIVFNDILDDYGVYGFRDTTKVCGTSEDCVWADNIHPGSKVHEILAKDLSRALNMAEKLTNVLNVL